MTNTNDEVEMFTQKYLQELFDYKEVNELGLLPFETGKVSDIKGE